MKAKEKLSIALKNANAPEWMIANADRGYYADFESELATPIMQLVNDCQKNGLSDIATEYCGYLQNEFIRRCGSKECETWRGSRFPLLSRQACRHVLFACRRRTILPPCQM